LLTTFARKKYLFNMYSVETDVPSFVTACGQYIHRLYLTMKQVWLGRNRAQLDCLRFVYHLALHENMFEVLCIDMNAANYSKCKCMLIGCV